MNQLQWSTHHWHILTAFLILATIETFSGTHQAFYQGYALLIQKQFSLSFDNALGIVVGTKLVLMLSGALAFSYLIWFVGGIMGKRTSKRVLLRRMTAALTFFLAGYVCSNFAVQTPVFEWVSYGLYAWGLILGYFSVREHFGLNTFETAVIGAFGLFVIISTWHFSSVFFTDFLNTQVAQFNQKPQITEVAKAPVARPVVRVKNRR
jgi:hypothetical protein